MNVICYADDTLVTARGKTFRDAARLASAGGDLVAGRIHLLGLNIALEKTEAIWFHGPRQRLPSDAFITVGGVRTPVRAELKYLGLTLDCRWQFGPHFRGLSPRLLKAANTLSWLLPNLGGPSSRCRQLYAGILRSMALYGAPIWAESLPKKGNAALLKSPQRAIAQRVARAYRTVSFSAACTLAGTPPWQLEAGVLAAVYEWTATKRAEGESFCPIEKEAVRREASESLVRRWSEDLTTVEVGRRTLDALAPVLDRWLVRPYGFLTFRMVQVMTGHGCFGSYLHRIRREEAPSCHECGAAEDTAHHTLAVCLSWAPQRSALVARVGCDLTLTGIVNAILEGEEAWKAFATFCEEVMTAKEAAERERVADPLAGALRRARRGRRRRTIARHLPPLRGGSQSAPGTGVPGPALHRTPPLPDVDSSAFPVVSIAPPSPSGRGSVLPTV
jgi:hypothetical protein